MTLSIRAPGSRSALFDGARWLVGLAVGLAAIETATAAPSVLPAVGLTVEVASGEPWVVVGDDMFKLEAAPALTVVLSRRLMSCASYFAGRLALGPGQEHALPPQAPASWHPVYLAATALPPGPPIPMLVACRDDRDGSIGLAATYTGTAFDATFWDRLAPMLAGLERAVVSSAVPVSVVATPVAAPSPAIYASPPFRSVGPASLHDRLTAELSLATSLVLVDDVMGASASAKAIGVQARFGGSLYELVKRVRRPGHGLRIRDAWMFAAGAGYMTGNTDGALWGTFRLEAALRAVYQMSDATDVFARAGYLVVLDTSRRNPGCFSSNGCSGYDDWIVTAGARAGKLFGEAGLGWSADDRTAGYRLATVQYRYKSTGLLRYVGFHYEGSAAANGFDPSTHTLRLVFASH